MIRRWTIKHISQALEDNRIPLIMGLRRIGKTVMLSQVEDIYPDARTIVWDDFINLKYTDVEFYNIIDAECKRGGILLFDEVQAREGWDIILKNMFDKYVSKGVCKIVATGSSSMVLAAKDLGVTRMKKIYADTWDFSEYCELVGKKRTVENFEEFIGYGFPEKMKERPEFKVLLNDALKPILEDDIPKAYPGTDTLLLIRFVDAIATSTNGEINEAKLANRAGVSIITARKYLELLERAMLLRKVHMIHPDLTFPKKKKYKVYLNPHFHLWLLGKRFKDLDNKIKGHIIESYWLVWATTRKSNKETFYYMKDKRTGKEIDFILLEGGEIKEAYEFKYKNNVTPDDITNLLSIDAKNKYLVVKEVDKSLLGIDQISIMDIQK